MARGDHCFVWRRHKGVPYQHHAIDLGDGCVVHFTDGDGGAAGPGGSVVNFVIQKTSLAMLTRNGQDELHIIEHQLRLTPDEVIERALEQVGRRGYHLVFDNCEHFACWCVLDRHESRQVAVACERLSAVGVKAIAVGSAHLVTRVGVKRMVRSANPWLLVADAAQWATEAGGHHVGLRDPQRRRRAGRAIGATTAIGLGACGGPVGIVIAGGLWCAGEVAGEASRAVYDRVRGLRHST